MHFEAFPLSRPAGNPGAEPMAVAVMSGLLFATVLRPGFVPVLDSLLFRVRIGEAGVVTWSGGGAAP